GARRSRRARRRCASRWASSVCESVSERARTSMNFVGRFWRSQLGKKIVMAVTGLIGVLFVLGHMLGNLQAFEEPAKINAYGRFLHHTVGTELWLVQLVLLAAVVLHVVAATQPTLHALE